MPTTNEPRVSQAALEGATGRGWEDWFAVLDEWGAADRGHGEIAAWLMGEHGVDNWWSQTITVEYEHARGLRPRGGHRDGTFDAGASKTVAVPVERLYAAFVDAEQRERWLPGVQLRERTTQPLRSARFDFQDGATRVVVGFEAKGESKSQVALIHQRLRSSEDAEERRAYWRERLAALKALLEG